jgi:hypothetical protein
MSDFFKLPNTGDKIPNSATLVNAMLEGAREDSDADSRQSGSIPTSLEFFPHRVVFIRNTTQFQIPNDQPIPIGKPSGNTDVINGQVVFPIVSYVPGWATFARPLKRLPPGCAGPAVILGWLGPGRRPARYIYGQQLYRRTQPQRSYGGTTFTGLPYVQATHRNFPRPANSPWRQAWLGESQKGIAYSGDLTARFPKMESLGFLSFPWVGETYIEFRHPVDQHGWWTPTLEFRTSRGSGNFQTNYVYPPAYQSVTADLRGTFARFDRHYIEPIFWMPAVSGFNATPQAYNGNFNHDPMVSGDTFNPNAGAPPQDIFHTKSCPTHFSTKILWAETEEPYAIHRSYFGGGPSYYFFEAQGNWPATWNIQSYLPTVRLMPGPEVVQIFETDRDDARTFQGTVIDPGIGTGPGGPSPSGASIVGPELQGPIGFSRLTATKTNVSELIQPVSSATAFGSRLGSGAPATASATVSSGGTFV